MRRELVCSTCAIVLMSVATAAADSAKIKGQYAFTGAGSCLWAPGFSPTPTNPTPGVALANSGFCTGPNTPDPGCVDGHPRNIGPTGKRQLDQRCGSGNPQHHACQGPPHWADIDHRQFPDGDRSDRARRQDADRRHGRADGSTNDGRDGIVLERRRVAAHLSSLARPGQDKPERQPVDLLGQRSALLTARTRPDATSHRGFAVRVDGARSAVESRQSIASGARHHGSRSVIPRASLSRCVWIFSRCLPWRHDVGHRDIQPRRGPR